MTSLQTTPEEAVKSIRYETDLMKPQITPIFVIIVQDRHSDVDVEVWLDRDKAVMRARNLAHEYCRHPEDYSEMQPLPADWVFHATYSCEDDCIWVLRKEVQ